MLLTQDPALEELPEATIEKAREALTYLRIPRSLSGFRYLAMAIALAAQVPERLERITKEIYPEIARRCGTKVVRAERCMRTAVDRCWEQGNREALDQMAGYHLVKRPTNSEFIDLVSMYISKV